VAVSSAIGLIGKTVKSESEGAVQGRFSCETQICGNRLFSNCIYQQFTLRKAKERLSPQCPGVLGIDEHTLHKAKHWEFPTEVIFLRRIMLPLTEVLFDIFQLTVGKTGNT
jgi:hypothetical protein